jgi:hypothetical protein
MSKRFARSVLCALPLLLAGGGAFAFTSTSGPDGGGATSQFADPDQRVSAFGGSDDQDPVAWSLLATKDQVNPPRDGVKPAPAPDSPSLPWTTHLP